MYLCLRKDFSIMETNNAMKASEPVAAYPTMSYADMMAYIHSVHISREDKEKLGRRLVVEVTQPALAEAYERIEHLSTLENDWDGEGGLPVSPKVLNNLKSVLMISDNADWENWAISPDSNATIGLQSFTTDALISLGAYEYSYYARIDGVRYGESHVDFSPQSFLQLMRKFG